MAEDVAEDPVVEFRGAQRRLAALAGEVELVVARSAQAEDAGGGRADDAGDSGLAEGLARLSEALAFVERDRTTLPRRQARRDHAEHAPRTRAAALVVAGAATALAAVCMVGWWNRWGLALLVPIVVAGLWLAVEPAPDPDRDTVADERVAQVAGQRWEAAVSLALPLVPTLLVLVWSPWWLIGAIPLTLLVVTMALEALGVLPPTAEALRKAAVSGGVGARRG